jgi:hypothetical protein
LGTIGPHDDGRFAMTGSKKGGKKKLLAVLAAIAGALFIVKKKRGKSSEPGWEEANPTSTS